MYTKVAGTWKNVSGIWVKVSGTWKKVLPQAANFSNTATGSGAGYKYVTFNSSGTLTVTQAGFADILVVGGGGGSAYDDGRIGGGGAGQVLSFAVELSATTYTITVGAGGSSAQIFGSVGSSSSIGTSYVAGGGGGGVARNTNDPATDNINFRSAYTSGGGNAGGVELTRYVSETRPGMGSLAGGTNAYDGVTSDITGTSVEYGIGGNSGTPSAKGSGGWSTSTNGVSGVVIVRVAT